MTPAAQQLIRHHEHTYRNPCKTTTTEPPVNPRQKAATITT